MKGKQWKIPALLAAAGVAACGCRAHPVSLAISVIGDVVDDQDIRNRQPLLLGKRPSAADEMFGERHDTLVDVGTGRTWLIYPEPDEHFAESFYVVEAQDQRIVALFKCKRNIDGLEDVEQTRELRRIVLGRTPAECEATGNLGKRLLIMRSQANGALAFFYDAHDWTHTRGARYCVLVFDVDGMCRDVRMVGVTASTNGVNAD